jgi:hypothetical protein
VVRSWLHIVLKGVVMAVTMCSGIRVATYDMPVENAGHEGERDITQSQLDLDCAA